MGFKKIRMLTKGNKTGDSYGITIPRDIALSEKYKYTSFRIVKEGNNILLVSGTYRK